MGILATIVIGFFAGLIARFLKPGDDKMGLVMTTIVGIIGAFLGGYLGQALGFYRADEPAGFLGAIVGAVIVLFILNLVTSRRSRHV